MSLVAACRISAFALVAILVISAASGRREDCIGDVDLEKLTLILRSWSGERGFTNVIKRKAVELAGPNFLNRKALLCGVRFFYINETYYQGPPLAIYDDEAADGDSANDTSTIPSEVYIATSSQYYYRLGAALFDILTLGSLSVSDRTNRSTIVLYYPACPDVDQFRINSKIFQLVLKVSGMETDTLQLKKLNDDDSSVFFSVTLFMPLGLLSLFLTILIFPCLCQFIILTLTPKVDKQTLINAELSLLSTASLEAAFFILYWTLSAIAYYCRFAETVDGVIFQNRFFSPISQSIIFYFLAVTASNVGGMLFSRCTQGHRARVTCCTVMGQGLLSSCTTAAIFHSFFLILALFQDPLSVLTNLVVFLTVNILLFLAIFAIMEQFRRQRFQGNFILVVMMQMTLSSLYYSLVASFASISFDEETSNATVPYLCVVTIISIACMLLSIAAIKMMDKKKKSADTKNDVENPPIKKKSSDGDGGGVKKSTELAVINPRPGAADLAALAREMGFIVLIPGAVQAWQRRGENEGKV